MFLSFNRKMPAGFFHTHVFDRLVTYTLSLGGGIVTRAIVIRMKCRLSVCNRFVYSFNFPLTAKLHKPTVSIMLSVPNTPTPLPNAFEKSQFPLLTFLMQSFLCMLPNYSCGYVSCRVYMQLIYTPILAT